MKTKNEYRREAKEFRANMEDQAKGMKVNLPAHYWCPGPNRFITAGQYVTALKAILSAPPEQEFRQSFQSWSPRTAAEIRRWEIVPAIHDRINARGFMERAERARFIETLRHNLVMDYYGVQQP